MRCLVKRCGDKMDINKRMKKATEAAQLSVSDLAFWLETGRNTVHTWLQPEQTHVPLKTRHSQINQKLDLLEAAIKAGKYFPVPLRVKQQDRKTYLRWVLDAVSGRVSKTRSSK